MNSQQNLTWGGGRGAFIGDGAFYQYCMVPGVQLGILLFSNVLHYNSLDESSQTAMEEKTWGNILADLKAKKC